MHLERNMVYFPSKRRRRRRRFPVTALSLCKFFLLLDLFAETRYLALFFVLNQCRAVIHGVRLLTLISFHEESMTVLMSHLLVVLCHHSAITAESQIWSHLVCVRAETPLIHMRSLVNTTLLTRWAKLILIMSTFCLFHTMGGCFVELASKFSFFVSPEDYMYSFSIPVSISKRHGILTLYRWQTFLIMHLGMICAAIT